MTPSVTKKDRDEPATFAASFNPLGGWGLGMVKACKARQETAPYPPRLCISKW